MLKRIILLSMVLVSISLLNATIITVDLYGGGDYDRIHDAVAAAAAGDTVLVMSADYIVTSDDGAISVDKKLYVLGTGYDPVAEGGTSIRTNISGLFSFTTNAGGSILKGLRIRAPGDIVTLASDNTIIEENFFILTNNNNTVVLSSGVQEDTVRSNIFTKTSSEGNGIKVTDTDDCLINNNIFGGVYKGIYNWSNTNLIISNNLFLSIGFCGIENGNYSYPYQPDNAAIFSNIFMNGRGIYLRYGNPTISYNGFFNNSSDGTMSYPEGSTFYTDDPVFENFDSGDSYDHESVDNDNYDFHLQSTSTYIDAGYPYVDWRDVDASLNDLGIYGGPWPFMGDFGIPTIPNVISISVTPSTVSPSGTITINATGRIGSGTSTQKDSPNSGDFDTNQPVRKPGDADKPPINRQSGNPDDIRESSRIKK